VTLGQLVAHRLEQQELLHRRERWLGLATLTIPEGLEKALLTQRAALLRLPLRAAGCVLSVLAVLAAVAPLEKICV